MNEPLFKSTTSHLSHDLVEIPALAPIFGAARRAHDGIEATLRQDGQRIDDQLMILVLVKLIWQVEVFCGQLVQRNYLGRSCGQKRRRWLGCEANHADLILCA